MVDHTYEFKPLAVGCDCQCVSRIFESCSQVKIEYLKVEFSRLYLRKIEDLVDHSEKGIAAVANDFSILALFRGQLSVQQEPGHADHSVHGCPDLVAHVGEKLAFGLVGVVGGNGQLISMLYGTF